jgi:hypothetical protein
MSCFRSMMPAAALGLTVLLAGCVAYPAYPAYQAYPAYGYGYGYGAPYYGGVYVGGGRHEGWHGGGWHEGWHGGGWHH